MNLIISRYSSTLLPLIVAVLGVLEAANQAGKSTLLDWQTITQIVLLLVGTGVVYWLPLVDSRWHGAFKTGAAIVFAALSALVAIVPDGHVTKANIILVLTAIVKAVATELGVQIRTDAAKTIDAGSSSEPGVPVITTVAAASSADGEYAVFPQPVDAVGSAEVEQPVGPDDVNDDPKHLATS